MISWFLLQLPLLNHPSSSPDTLHHSLHATSHASTTQSSPYGTALPPPTPARNPSHHHAAGCSRMRRFSSGNDSCASGADTLHESHTIKNIFQTHELYFRRATRKHVKKQNHDTLRLVFVAWDIQRAMTKSMGQLDVLHFCLDDFYNCIRYMLRASFCFLLTVDLGRRVAVLAALVFRAWSRLVR